MKKLLNLVLAVVVGFSLAACSTPVGHKLAEGHKAAFGCWPEGYTPPRVLEAQGPKEDTCGRPVYKRPECSECPEGNCEVPK